MRVGFVLVENVRIKNKKVRYAGGILFFNGIGKRSFEASGTV